MHRTINHTIDEAKYDNNSTSLHFAIGEDLKHQITSRLMQHLSAWNGGNAALQEVTYKKVRQYWNHKKAEQLGNHLFSKILSNLFLHLVTVESWHRIVLFIDICCALLQETIQYPRTKALPLICAAVFVKPNKYKTFCLHLLDTFGEDIALRTTPMTKTHRGNDGKTRTKYVRDKRRAKNQLKQYMQCLEELKQQIQNNQVRQMKQKVDEFRGWIIEHKMCDPQTAERYAPQQQTNTNWNPRQQLQLEPPTPPRQQPRKHQREKPVVAAPQQMYRFTQIPELPADALQHTTVPRHVSHERAANTVSSSEYYNMRVHANQHPMTTHPAMDISGQHAMESVHISMTPSMQQHLAHHHHDAPVAQSRPGMTLSIIAESSGSVNSYSPIEGSFSVGAETNRPRSIESDSPSLEPMQFPDTVTEATSVDYYESLITLADTVQQQQQPLLVNHVDPNIFHENHHWNDDVDVLNNWRWDPDPAIDDEFNWDPYTDALFDHDHGMDQD
eukprot:CAMPEP_0197029728 /NCGR_PEP_ID=MMETSP1384-20130603/9120_1 /TAXON_ID=29189 /ORGANISM="Ammonia sp." /LENGTH=499 /DNA_ID=CAMNT_0042458949 /DNA_START=225 /DNA_END=1724 /DNA_ORIENTATION=-